MTEYVNQKSSDIDAILLERQSIISILSYAENIFMRELLLHSFSLPFKHHRDNYYDRELEVP